MIEKTIENLISKYYDKYLALQNITKKKHYEKEITGCFLNIIQDYFSDAHKIRFKKISDDKKGKTLSILTFDNSKDLCDKIKENYLDVGIKIINLKTYKEKKNFHHILTYKNQDNSVQIFCTAIEDHTLSYKERQELTQRKKTK